MRFCIYIFLVSLVCCGSNANAGISFNVQSFSVDQNLGGATTGLVNVFLTSTAPDLGTQVVGAQMNVRLSGVTGSITGVTFGPAIESATDFFSGSLNNIAGFPATNVGGTTAQGPPVGLPANGGLMAFTFSVAQGQTGTFGLSFDESTAIKNTLTTAVTFVEITPSFNSGTITITAVPEPTSILLFGAATTMFGVRRWRKRRLAVAKS